MAKVKEKKKAKKKKADKAKAKTATKRPRLKEEIRELYKTVVSTLEKEKIVVSKVNDTKVRLYHRSIKQIDDEDVKLTPGSTRGLIRAFWLGEARIFSGKVNIGFHKELDKKSNLLSTKMKSNFTVLSSYEATNGKAGIAELKNAIIKVSKLAIPRIKAITE